MLIVALNNRNSCQYYSDYYEEFLTAVSFLYFFFSGSELTCRDLLVVLIDG